MTQGSNEANWARLKTVYSSTGVALFLGAGVSYASGLPNWEELVGRLVQDRDDIGGIEFFRRCRSAGFSLPTITEFVKSKYEDYDQFTDSVRRALYRDFPCRSVKKTFEKPGIDRIIEHVKTCNPLLDAIYDLATIENDRIIRANQKIPYIVNFNLDSLIGAYDSARHSQLNPGTKDRCFHKIASSGSSRIAGRTSVYHPHGYLRFEDREFRLGKEAKSMVLTEFEYYDFYNKPTKIFTYTILSLFREISCLFVGMSMTDENIRRLLFYSNQERDIERGHRQKDAPRHFAVLRTPDASVKEILEQTLSKLAVQPLWVADFSEIPRRLIAIRKSE